MAGNIAALRDHISGMMGKMKDSPSARTKVKSKARTKMMYKKSQKNC